MSNTVQITQSRPTRARSRRPPTVRLEVASNGRKQKGKPKQKRNNKMVRGKSKGTAATPTALLQYRRALQDPFAQLAIGVRAPDSICYPTITTHKRVVVNATSSAGGVIAAAFFPLPTLSTYVNTGTLSGAYTAFANNPSLGYLLNPSGVAAYFQCYRVVAWGIRISLADTNTAAKGQYFLAPLLMPSQMPGWNKIESVGLTNQTTSVYSAFNIPAIDSTIANLPGAVSFSAQDFLAHGSIVGTAPPYDKSALDFKRANTSVHWTAAVDWATESLVTTATGAGVANSYDNAECHNTAGMTGLAIYGTGLPATTNEINIEVIYHMEGMPIITGAMVPTSTPSPAGSTAAVERVLTGLTKGAQYFRIGNEAVRAGVNLASTAALMYGRYASKGSRLLM